MARRIGRYAIVERLGAGNMGEVFRGRAGDGGPDVAIKLTKEAAPEQRLKRLRREGELTGRLEHPAIVRLLDSGSHVGCPYLVYELVEGARSITSAFDDLTLGERVELVRDAARGLGHAHANGIVHRDVKPDNLLVDRDGRVRVADFGLAYAADLERMTRSGMTVGTPLYMSPEHLGGKSLSPQSDVWALGMILFEALAGAPAFRATTIQSVVDHIMHDELRSPLSVNPQVPRNLSLVCMRALERNVKRRYADANGLADALDLALDPSATASAIGPLPAAQQRVVATAAAIVLGVLVVAALLLFALRPEAPPPGDEPIDSATDEIAVDLTPPTIVLTGDGEGAWVTDRELTVLEGTVSDPSGPVTLKLDGEPLTVVDGAFSAQRELIPGANPFTVSAEDALGNRTQLTTIRYRAPSWYVQLDPKRRAPLPLPTGLRFGTEPGDYRNAIDGSLLRWVWVPKRSERLFTLWRFQRRVLFSQGYYLGKHEVTWGQYRRFCEETATELPPRKRRIGATPEHPATGVSWSEARDYCRWAGLRLPTEAEWEHGATGVDGRLWPWGNDPSISNRSNLKEEADHADGFLQTSPVGSFPDDASPFGCLDMAGNVFEWVHDLYTPELTTPEGQLLVDPQGATSGEEYAVKGGGYDHPKENARSRNTYHDVSGRRLVHRGFRAARSAR